MDPFTSNWYTHVDKSNTIITHANAPPHKPEIKQWETIYLSMVKLVQNSELLINYLVQNIGQPMNELIRFADSSSLLSDLFMFWNFKPNCVTIPKEIDQTNNNRKIFSVKWYHKKYLHFLVVFLLLFKSLISLWKFCSSVWNLSWIKRNPVVWRSDTAASTVPTFWMVIKTCVIFWQRGTAHKGGGRCPVLP